MKSTQCALLATLLAGAFLSGCTTKPVMLIREHGDDASMQSALATVIYHPNADGSLTAEQKRLPWESNMGNYALSFVLDDTRVGYECRTDGGLISVDIARFPVFDDAASEQAAVSSIVNTLSALPGVEQVTLTFDGEHVTALKNGTPVGGTFAAPTPTPASNPTPMPESTPHNF